MDVKWVLNMFYENFWLYEVWKWSDHLLVDGIYGVDYFLPFKL